MWGLVLAIEKLLSNSGHRHCLRHLYNNFKQNFKGLTLKDRVWKVVITSNVPTFNRQMEWMNEEDRNTYNWLASKLAINWSRSHFGTSFKYDMLLKNLCELFNATLIEARQKPILSMLEDIRVYMMRRMKMKGGLT